MWDALPSGPEPRPRPRFWPRSISEAGAATATFLLSATVFSVAGLNAWRGSRIEVLPLERIYLYRDGEGEKSALLMSVEARIINEASRDYGDVLQEAMLEVQGAGPDPALGFKADTLAELVFTANTVAGADTCPVGARCMALANALVVERPYKLLDVAGAASRTESFGFNLQAYRCSGDARCNGFSSYALSAAALRRMSPLHVTLRLQFNGDGRKAARCATTKNTALLAATFEQLERRGWATLACETGA